MRRQFAFVLAAALGAAAAALPALAGSETPPTIEAVNVGSGFYQEHHWQPAQALIASGGTVTFSNPSEVPHGVEWLGSVKPSCEEGPGKVPVGSSPAASGTKWSGACTFSQAGTYTFDCTVHGPAMSGTVTVQDSGTTTSTTPSTPPGREPSPTVTTTAGAPPATPGVPVLQALQALQALKLPSRQRGVSVHGSVLISTAGMGGRLEVDLLARRAAVAVKPEGAARVLVGRLLRSTLKAGRASFTVGLDHRARRALHRHGQLALRVRIVLSTVAGTPTSITRTLVLHI
jgi:plastocyanin